MRLAISLPALSRDRKDQLSHVCACQVRTPLLPLPTLVPVTLYLRSAPACSACARLFPLCREIARTNYRTCVRVRTVWYILFDLYLRFMFSPSTTARATIANALATASCDGPPVDQPSATTDIEYSAGGAELGLLHAAAVGSDLSTAWSKDGKPFTPSVLFQHLNHIINQQGKRPIPCKPPVPALARKELPSLGKRRVSRVSARHRWLIILAINTYHLVMLHVP